MRIIISLWARNLKLFVRNKIQLVFTIAMPFFFLYVFTSIFQDANIEDPQNYMLAGIVITTVFQTSLSIATSTIEDIVSGFMKEVLVSPVKRMHIAIGQLLSAATIATLQGIIILIIGFFIGLTFTSWLTPILVILSMALVGIVFSGLGLFLATTVKNAQTFQVVQTAVTMPLTFLCGAYIPLDKLPDLLRYFAYLNPMTYTTAFFRTIILEKGTESLDKLLSLGLAFEIGSFTITPTISFFIVIIFGAIFMLLSARVFSKVDFSKISRSKGGEDDVWG